MTQWWDVFGSKSYYNNISSPADKLESFKDYIDSNTAPQYENAVSDNVIPSIYTSPNIKVDIESKRPNSDDVEVRRQGADEWLQDNHDTYGASSICIVFDYQVTNSANAGSAGDVNEYGQKTSIVNTYVSHTDWPTFSDEFIASHEIGHSVSCRHTDVSYSNGTIYNTCTFMHSPGFGGSGCHGKSVVSVDYELDTFSSCSEQTMEK